MPEGKNVRILRAAQIADAKCVKVGDWSGLRVFVFCEYSRF